MIRVDIEDEATAHLQRMYDNWDATTIKGAKKLASAFAERMREHINNGDFKVEPKADTWYSHDPRPFINYGGYVKSIRAVGNGVVCDTQVMNWLEHGTRRQPPRPHWGPLLRQFARFEVTDSGREMMYELLGH